MNQTAIIMISLLAGAVVGGGIAFGAQALNQSPDHFVKVETEGPTATITASNCQGETCDVTVAVEEWNAIDALVVEDRGENETVVLSRDRETVTFKDVSESDGQGAIRTYLPIVDREGFGYEGRDHHRLVNLKEESKTISPSAFGVYCPSKKNVVVDGDWNESEFAC